ncbi:MAG: DUF1292 domain-containing protein [Bacilli bacterium]|nr:DUF1292 domain-containing protein [Bacilli bacterium]
MEENFEIELTNGEKKQAKFITTIKVEGKDYEYGYYSIEEGETASIFAGKIVLENGKKIMKNLENEEERKYAYKVFSETYKELREQNK